MATIVFNRFKRDLINGDANFDGATWKALLTKTAGVTDPDLDFVADVLATAADEITVAGYSRQTLASKTVTLDDTGNRGLGDSDALSFGTLTAGETVTGMLIYREVTNDSDSPVYAWYDLTDTATNGTAFVVTPNADGWFEVV